MLSVINLVQHLLVILLFVIPLAYIIALIHVILVKVGDKKVSIKKPEKIWLAMGIPLFILSIWLYTKAEPILGDWRYGAWTEKCGHEPIVGVDGLFEPTKSAFQGELAKGYADIASKYFCSVDEAKSAGYNPLFNY